MIVRRRRDVRIIYRFVVSFVSVGKTIGQRVVENRIVPVESGFGRKSAAHHIAGSAGTRVRNNAQRFCTFRNSYFDLIAIQPGLDHDIAGSRFADCNGVGNWISRADNTR